MAENLKHLTTDNKNVIVDMRNEAHKLQDIADVSKGTVKGVISRYELQCDMLKIYFKLDVIVYCQ